MVIAPSPAATDPDVTRHRSSQCGLYYRSRRWWRDDDWRRGDDNRGRNRDSEVDTETNPGIHRGDANGCQGQNCDSLFHNLYRFDAVDGQNIVTTALPFCK